MLSVAEVHFRYGVPLRIMSRLRFRPRGFILRIAFGREPSTLTGGIFTRVGASFPSALQVPAAHARYCRGAR